MTDTPTTDDEHPAQITGRRLSEGDAVLCNDRTRPLAVVGQHERQQTSRTWRRRGESKYHVVVRLTGNGTEYHLLCTPGSSHGPMLYKESDWDDHCTDKLGNSPKYARSGERVESITVVDETESA